MTQQQKQQPTTNDHNRPIMWPTSLYSWSRNVKNKNKINNLQMETKQILHKKANVIQFGNWKCCQASNTAQKWRRWEANAWLRLYPQWREAASNRFQANTFTNLANLNSIWNVTEKFTRFWNNVDANDNKIVDRAFCRMTTSLNVLYLAHTLVHLLMHTRQYCW